MFINYLGRLFEVVWYIYSYSYLVFLVITAVMFIISPWVALIPGNNLLLFDMIQ